ncbi:hypothetical protein M514_00582, partial [Trichuris suis]
WRTCTTFCSLVRRKARLWNTCRSRECSNGTGSASVSTQCPCRGKEAVVFRRSGASHGSRMEDTKCLPEGLQLSAEGRIG